MKQNLKKAVKLNLKKLEKMSKFLNLIFKMFENFWKKLVLGYWRSR